MMDLQPPVAKICTANVEDGRVYMELQATGDVLNPPMMHLETAYQPPPKTQFGRALYSTASATGPFVELPIGEHSLVLNGSPPDYTINLVMSLRGSCPSVEVQARASSQTAFRSGRCSLERGSLELLIGAADMDRPPGKPMRMLVGLDTKGAFDYRHADYDDHTGGGRKPLRKGDNFIEAQEPLALFLSLGECAGIELVWRWMG